MSRLSHTHHGGEVQETSFIPNHHHHSPHSVRSPSMTSRASSSALSRQPTPGPSSAVSVKPKKKALLNDAHLGYGCANVQRNSMLTKWIKNACDLTARLGKNTFRHMSPVLQGLPFKSYLTASHMSLPNAIEPWRREKGISHNGFKDLEVCLIFSTSPSGGMASINFDVTVCDLEACAGRGKAFIPLFVFFYTC